jgi:hypothetical protein
LKKRCSSIDLGTVSERNQNREKIVSVNLGTVTNSQIVASHTFIGDVERERETNSTGEETKTLESAVGINNSLAKATVYMHA